MKSKAQAGATATWIVAIIVIFLGMVIFIVSTLTLSTKEKYFGENKDLLIQKNKLNGDLALQSSIEGFLEKDFPKEEIKISEMLAKNELSEEERKFFEEEADKIFNEILSHSLLDGEPYWTLKLEKVLEDGKIEKEISAGEYNCIEEKSLTAIHAINEKKLVLCIDAEYYEKWGRSKYG